MGAFYVVLIAAIFSSARAQSDYRYEIPYDGILLNESISIFPIQKDHQSLDKAILKSLQTTTNLFHDFKESKNTKTGVLGAKLAPVALAAIALGAKFVPYLNAAVELVTGLADIFAKETTWKEEFSKVFDKQIKENNAANNIYNMGNVLPTINRKIRFINKTIANEENLKNDTLIGEIRSHAADVNFALENMINSFERHDSYFRDFPLIGAPVLIEISLIIAAFEPVARKLVAEASHNQLSCRMYDTMHDYLPFMVAVRLDKVHANFKSIMDVRNAPYNPNGYTNTKTLNCADMFYDSKRSVCTDRFRYHLVKGDNRDCLVDDSSTLQLYKRRDIYDCEVGYAQHLRTLVEKMFPIEVLKTVCGKEPKTLNGSGWARIRLRQLHAYKLKDGHNCDAFAVKCDPYIRITITPKDSPKVVKMTDIKDGTESYDVGFIMTTELIQRGSTQIKFEVFDADKINNERDPDNDELVLEATGTVDYFMINPNPCVEPWHNCIEIDIIWLNKREDEN